MRQGIRLLGLVLMVVALPLYAGISRPDSFVWTSSTAASSLRISLNPVAQMADSLISGGQGFPIWDTRLQAELKPDDLRVVSSLTPAFEMTRRAAPVPEPLHYALMGLGLVGLYLARRDRLNAK